jgi:Retroviral aspartyl protease
VRHDKHPTAVDYFVKYIESDCPPLLATILTASTEDLQARPKFFAIDDLSSCGGSVVSDTNVFLGFLGSATIPINKNLLQIPAIVSAKHGDAKATVYALVDTAATHCFIHCNLVSKLGLKVHHFKDPLSAKLGNGLGMPIIGYTYVSLQMNDFREEVKCLVSNIGDLGIILGDEWLSSRNVVVSYNPKRLTVVSHGKHHKLTGVHDIAKYGLNSTIVDVPFTENTVMDATKFFHHMQTDGF